MKFKAVLVLLVSQFFFINSINCQIVPVDDPLYYKYIHKLRINHSFDYYSKTLPFSIDILTERKNTKPANGMFKITPYSNISGYYNNIVMQMWISSVTDNWSILAAPVITLKKHGRELYGTEFVRNGLSGRFTHALIRYDTEKLTAQFGRAPVWWGQSWNNSIINSINMPGVDHFSLQLTAGGIYYNLLAGQLSSEYIEDIRIKRYLSGHRLSSILFGKLFISIGEQIIYSGQNRSIEFTYLNPLIPYVFTAYEYEEESSVDGSDNDNSIIFFNGRYLLKPNLSTYFEFILDDYQLDDNDIPHSIGYNLGIDGGYQIGEQEVSFAIEYASLGSWTYIHHGEYTSWQNLGHPIGNKYGPDCRLINSIIEYWLFDKYQIKLNFTNLEKGVNNLFTTWASPGTKGKPHPSPPVTRHSLLVTSIKWFAKYGILEFGYSNYPISNGEIDGDIDKPNGSLFIKAQLIWGFEYNLD